jgi:hypothetical protein
MVEAFKKLKDPSDKLCKETNSRITMFTCNSSKRLKLQNLFFNKIQIILSLGKLFTEHNKTLNLSEWKN